VQHDEYGGRDEGADASPGERPVPASEVAAIGRHRGLPLLLLHRLDLLKHALELVLHSPEPASELRQVLPSRQPEAADQRIERRGREAIQRDDVRARTREELGEPLARHEPLRRSRCVRLRLLQDAPRAAVDHCRSSRRECRPPT